MCDLAVEFGLLRDYMAGFGMVAGYRSILEGDGAHLLAEEAPQFSRAVDKVRRQSGAARALARRLMPEIGVEPGPILKGASGAPIWPRGVIGSLAHDENFAVAAIAPSGGGLSIGIDIELNLDLLPGTSAFVSTPTERRIYESDIIESRRLFVIKEAVYKASFPIDGRLLDFQDVEVDLAGCRAHTRFGLKIGFALAADKYLLSIATGGAF